MRAEKQLLLDEIKDKVEGSNALILLSYKNLSPNQAYELRQSILKTGGGMRVTSKRLLLKALGSAGIEITADSLSGHVAFVTVGQDAVESTKAVCTFKDNNKEMLEVLGGYFEGKVCSPSDVEEISSLPSKQEMRAQLLGVFEAPLAQTLGVIEALLTSVPYCLENKSNKES